MLLVKHRNYAYMYMCVFVFVQNLFHTYEKDKVTGSKRQNDEEKCLILENSYNGMFRK